jgi:TolA-binding protein
MKHLLVLICILGWGLSSQAQETAPPAIEQKDLDIYNLKAELEYYRQQLKKLAQDNEQLRDALQKKSTTIQDSTPKTTDANLRILYQALKEDHALAEQIISDIKAGAPNPVPAPQSLPKPAIDDSTFTQRYNAALNLYFEGHYPQAAEQFEKLVHLRRDHPLSDNCQYWLGECYYARQKYAEALTIFQKVRDLGDRNKADAALFKIGLTYLNLGRRAEAQKAFKELEQSYPNSELVPRARQYYQPPDKPEKF